VTTTRHRPSVSRKQVAQQVFAHRRDMKMHFMCLTLNEVNSQQTRPQRQNLGRGIVRVFSFRIHVCLKRR